MQKAEELRKCPVHTEKQICQSFKNGKKERQKAMDIYGDEF